MPWAAVRFILKVGHDFSSLALRLTAQASVNDTEKYAVVLEGVEIISNLLVRYDIYTTLYLGDKAKTTDEMRRCMVELCVSVLSFLAKARRFYERTNAGECYFYWTQWTVIMI